MPRRADQISESGELIEEIQRAFRGVERGKGVSLHETEVIDAYGSQDERGRARAKDTDRNWQEVQDCWIEEFGGVGGLSFLDAEGLRYYLPAYMTYWLRTGKEPNMLAYHLQRIEPDLDLLLRPKQKQVIAKFLDYVRITFASREAGKALEGHWHQFLNGTSQA
jgi:hypothetical protein